MRTRAPRGVFLAKQDLVIAGLDVAMEAFQAVDARTDWDTRAREGDAFGPGLLIATVSGPARGLLTAERVALNFLQRMSGIATLTRRFVDAVAGTKAKIRDTRKTTPLLRLLEKRAVSVGGGVPHRSGLDAGHPREGQPRAPGRLGRRGHPAGGGRAAGFLHVEIEVERKEQIEEALAAGAQMLLLDNFTVGQVRDAVAQIAGRVPVEVSGGVRLDTVRAYAEAGPDYIAVGALTHSAPAVDISLEIEPVG